MPIISFILILMVFVPATVVFIFLGIPYFAGAFIGSWMLTDVYEGIYERVDDTDFDDSQKHRLWEISFQYTRGWLTYNWAKLACCLAPFALVAALVAMFTDPSIKGSHAYYALILSCEFIAYFVCIFRLYRDIVFRR